MTAKINQSFKQSRNLTLGAVALAVGAMVMPSTSSAAVVVSESFEYTAGAYAGQAGGTGWNGGWRSTLTGTVTAAGTIGASSLPTPAGYGEAEDNVPSGGSFVGPTGGTAAYRTFAQSGVIDLSIDKDYYISFLTRRSGTARSFSMNLYSGSSATPVVGWGHATGGSLFSAQNGTTYNSSGAVIGNGATPAASPTYLWVVKIAAKSGTGIDQVSIEAYRGVFSPQTVGYEEPESWDYVGTNAMPNNVSTIDKMAVFMSSGGVLEVDEIRIGDTFADVTMVVDPTAVPEPATMAFAALAGGAALMRRARRQA